MGVSETVHALGVLAKRARGRARVEARRERLERAGHARVGAGEPADGPVAPEQEPLRAEAREDVLDARTEVVVGPRGAGLGREAGELADERVDARDALDPAR